MEREPTLVAVVLTWSPRPLTAALLVEEPTMGPQDQLLVVADSTPRPRRLTAALLVVGPMMVVALTQETVVPTKTPHTPVTVVIPLAGLSPLPSPVHNLLERPLVLCTPALQDIRYGRSMSVTL